MNDNKVVLSERRFVPRFVEKVPYKNERAANLYLPGSVQEISILVMHHTRENRSRLTTILKISLNKSDCRYFESYRKEYNTSVEIKLYRSKNKKKRHEPSVQSNKYLI